MAKENMNNRIVWFNLLFFFIAHFLSGCGKEQFGTVPKNTTNTAQPTSLYAYKSCTAFTLIKPKVDIIYFIDNSSSTYYIPDEIKKMISQTVNAISSEFDYRIIGTPLLEAPAGNDEYQVMTNSVNLDGIPSDKRRIFSAGDFDFFKTNPKDKEIEKGIERIVKFIDSHKNALIRKESHLITVLISNGRDLEIEEDKGFLNGETRSNETIYELRLSKLEEIKKLLESIQLRMISLTAKTVCKSEYRTALKSYVKMSNELYLSSGARDNNTTKDSYDLCSSGGVSSIFSAINSSIKQIILPHSYRYWPITFAENNELVSIEDIQVKKISPQGQETNLARDVNWFYVDKGSKQIQNLRELPSVGEPFSGRYFVRFDPMIAHPDCILITSKSKTEYFQYIVLPQKPRVETISVRINGKIIPSSPTNGWSDQTSVLMTINIKAPYPNPGDENPPVIRNGFMLKLNGTSNYYKSGDQVDVNFIPAGF